MLLITVGLSFISWLWFILLLRKAKNGIPLTSEERVLAWLGVILLIISVGFQALQFFSITPSFLTFLTPYSIYIVFCFAMVGAILLSFLIGRRSKKFSRASLKMENDQMTSATSMKEIPEFYSSREELPALEDFLRSAESEIDLMGFSLWDTVVQHRGTVIDLLKQGKHIRFILLSPTSDLVKRFEDIIVDANIKNQIQQSLEQLRKLKHSLSEVERGRLDIRTHDLLPFHTIIAIDAKSDSGSLNVEYYVYGTDSRSWPSLRISKKNQPQLFEKYWKSYEYVHEHSRDIDASNR